MKKWYLFCLLLLVSLSLSAQTVVDGFTFEGKYRQFRIYAPSSYNPASPTALVINMHGYTSDAFQQEIYSLMNPVADTAGFIVVYPDGVDNAWNSGFTPPYNGGVNDVGFISAMIDTLAQYYNLDPARVYACGMSNGGFMSFRLACDLEDRIAAIASVTGTMTTLQLNNCTASRAMPILQMHGDNDQTVAYFGNALSVSVDSTLNFWRAQNQCNAAPVYDSLPDLDPNDQSTVTSQYFGGCTDNVEILHYKVANGGHTWPGGIPFPQLGVTTQDIHGSREIWEFFLKWEHPNPTQFMVSRDDELNHPIDRFAVSPNPFLDELTLTNLKPGAEVELWNIQGQKVAKNASSQGTGLTLETGNLPEGMYVLKVRFDGQERVVKLIKALK